MKRDTLPGECFAEFLGTALLIIFGAGVVASLVVAGASFGQWEISITWGFAVSLAVYVTGGVSGAHINPAVTIALTLFKGFEKRKVLPFIGSQVLGAFVGAALVYMMYQPLFEQFEAVNNITRGSLDSLATAGIFSTYANSSISVFQAFLVEVFITALLMCCILGLGDDRNGAPKGAMPPLLIGILIAVIGASFGPLTGFAMNPARDFGPKLFAFLAGWGDVAMTGGRDIPYFLVPIFAPIVGACLGAFVYTRGIETQLDLKECGTPGCEIREDSADAAA
ncbi:aquaporin family protein [Sansalvadorimonas sp. 2012CJ34-2]|uniref:Aquaporin family protein n=1 Tax=Parendozoicomonas callyspongiae TaxID=2942213 RepID=A0ABT0PLR6_9GAMM|nr:MIP/aquaporin family protein [Sansalvadorimonas sp. 2012CJ34-2]MCL6271672.1 aquaporin family protein [Sansalvadorimonas sp. 2012CJ34-2]